MSFASPEGVAVEYEQVDGLDLPVTYSCSKFLADNPLAVETMDLVFFYDIIYSKSEQREDAVALVESSLLQKVALHYGVSNGVSCKRPQLDSIWPVEATSKPPDEPNGNLDDGLAECIELVPDDTQDCYTYIGQMSLGVVGPDDTEEVIAYIRAIMDSGEVTRGTTSQVRFVAASITEDVFGGKDQLPPAINVAEEPEEEPKNDSDSSVTPEGVVFVVGLLAAFVALVFVVVVRLRIRRQKRAEEINDAVINAESYPSSGSNPEVVQGYSYETDAAVQGYSQDEGDVQPPQEMAVQGEYQQDNKRDLDLEQAAMQGYTQNGSALPVLMGSQTPYDDRDMTNNTDDLPDIPDDFGSPFSFEMGDIQRNELLGLHGGGAISSTGREGGETSDSDVDSWAQTDASLGSIELRLEPITAEV